MLGEVKGLNRSSIIAKPLRAWFPDLSDEEITYKARIIEFFIREEEDRRATKWMESRGLT